MGRSTVSFYMIEELDEIDDQDECEANRDGEFGGQP